MSTVPASPPRSPSKVPLTEEEQLRADLRIEKRKTAALQREVERLKKQLITTSAESEAEEEAIVNRLSQRCIALKREKEQLAMQVEAEEELLTNILQKKLSNLKASKLHN